MRRSRFNLILIAAAVALSLVSPALADQVVYFVNGKAIMVKSVEKGEKFTVLEMDGGGKMGVPTDQISRIEDYVLSAPAVPQYVPPPPVQAPVQSATQTPMQAPAQAPGVAPGPGAAQAVNPLAGRVAVGIPANMPPAAPMVPGPGVGGRPLDPQGKGIAGLRPLDVSGGAAAQAPGPQRQAAQPTAGPAMGGPAGAFRGSAAGRPNFNPAGQRFNNRGGGMLGRRGRPQEVNRYLAQAPGAQVQPQPPAQGQPQSQGQQPAPGQEPAHPQDPPPPPQSTEEDPPTATEPEVEAQPPADPQDEKTEPEAPQPTEGETPDDSTGGAS